MAEVSSGNVRHHRCAARSPRPHCAAGSPPAVCSPSIRCTPSPRPRTHHDRSATPPANNATAAYQRLRSRLVYLKPPAAAEALPAILDAASDGQLTTLDALEQLLRTEAAAAAERKLISGCAAAASVAMRVTTHRRSP